MAIATAVTGLVGGAAQFFQGQSMRNKAQDAIDNFQWQNLQNPYDSLSVSTLGSDLRKEQASVNTAASVDALQSAGARGVLGGIGQVQAQNNMVNAQIAADLDEQQKNIDYAGAQYETRKQDMIEKRQSDELQGYGQMMNTGMNMQWNGISSGINSIGMFGQTELGQQWDNSITEAVSRRPTAQTLNSSISPMGYAPVGGAMGYNQQLITSKPIGY